MRMNKQIVVTDWIKEKPKLGLFLKLTLSSDERRILRGKRLTDCAVSYTHLTLPTIYSV